MEASPALLIVVGPTGSGKSALGLALARQLGGEIISADSVQLYRHFDIGSGKLLPSEREGVPHHGLDLLEPDEDVDASRFGELANAWVAEIRARGRVPIVCGGTFLWVRALVHGLFEAPPKDDATRERHRAFVEEHGRAALHERLREVDRDAYERLDPNDFVRVSRALEVYELSGKPISAFHREHAFRSVRHRALYVGIQHGNDLAARIERRVRSMFERGFVREVEDLCARGYRHARPMKSVGYRQIAEALEEGAPVPNENVEAAVVRATRIFSRRQRTWLREQPVTWLTPEAAHAGELPKALRDAPIG